MRLKIITISLLLLSNIGYTQYRITGALESWSEHNMIANSHTTKQQLKSFNNVIYGFTYNDNYYIVSYDDFGYSKYADFIEMRKEFGRGGDPLNDTLLSSKLKRNLYVYRYMGNGNWEIAIDKPLQTDYCIFIGYVKRNPNSKYAHTKYVNHYYLDQCSSRGVKDKLIHDTGKIIINSNNTITIILVNIYCHDTSKIDDNNSDIKYKHMYNNIVTVKPNDKQGFEIVNKERTDENSYLHKYIEYE